GRAGTTGCGPYPHGDQVGGARTDRNDADQTARRAVLLGEELAAARQPQPPPLLGEGFLVAQRGPERLRSVREGGDPDRTAQPPVVGVQGAYGECGHGQTVTHP